ncbi:ECF transporter S component [Streptomyces lavendulocolor]|uniref:ECF transporter S component n=1 Tax=Streptomyces lavendulocolor TaxID=67316 RepID=UPI003C2C7657
MADRAAGGGRPVSTARPVRLGPRSVAALVLISAIGVVAFGWPLLADGTSVLAGRSQDAPWLLAVVLPLLVAVVVATIADCGVDAKAVAMLGVLAAVGAALRPLGAGTAGLEPMFFLMVLSGRVLGPGFGFVLGAVTMFASALLTGGVGPWMPFQMLSMGWFTMGAGLLPGPVALRGRGELLMLSAYGAVAAFAYGTVMNLQGWVTLQGMGSGISFRPGDPVHENLVRFLAYCAATSLGWDLGRAVLTVVLMMTIGSTVLKALRRATRRAAFEAQVTFEGAGGAVPEPSGVRRPTGPTSHTNDDSGTERAAGGPGTSRGDVH